MKATWLVIAAATATLMFSGQAAASDAAAAGKEVFNKTLCKGCHAIDYEGYGPSFTDIGMKYGGDADAKAKLIAAVQKGSQGVWGDAAMPPQKNNVTEEQLSQIVEFILSLK